MVCIHNALNIHICYTLGIAHCTPLNYYKAKMKPLNPIR